jgi:hypothetical protein
MHLEVGNDGVGAGAARFFDLPRQLARHPQIIVVEKR